MSTVRELIVAALRDSGAFGRNQAVPGNAAVDGLKRLNWLLAWWNRKRWLVYRLATLSFTSTGAESYTVGPGGNFAMPERTDQIESAFMRQPNVNPTQPVDYYLKKILSREDYNLVRLKRLGTWAKYYFYDPDYPLGRVYFWPLPPTGQFEMFISFKQVLTQYAALTEEAGLPLEYENAIHWNLVVEFSDNYRISPSNVAVAKAKDGLNLIRGSYTAVSALRTPGAVRGRGRKRYDIFSDGNAN